MAQVHRMHFVIIRDSAWAQIYHSVAHGNVLVSIQARPNHLIHLELMQHKQRLCVVVVGVVALGL